MRRSGKSGPSDGSHFEAEWQNVATYQGPVLQVALDHNCNRFVVDTIGNQVVKYNADGQRVAALKLGARDPGTDPAALLSARGEHRGAVRLLGALSRVGHVFDWGLSREVGALVVNEQTVMDAARVALGDGGFADAWTEGELMTMAQASAEILEAR